MTDYVSPAETTRRIVSDLSAYSEGTFSSHRKITTDDADLAVYRPVPETFVDVKAAITRHLQQFVDKAYDEKEYSAEGNFERYATFIDHVKGKREFTFSTREKFIKSMDITIHNYSDSILVVETFIKNPCSAKSVTVNGTEYHNVLACVAPHASLTVPEDTPCVVGERKASKLDAMRADSAFDVLKLEPAEMYNQLEVVPAKKTRFFAMVPSDDLRRCFLALKAEQLSADLFGDESEYLQAALNTPNVPMPMWFLCGFIQAFQHFIHSEQKAKTAEPVFSVKSGEPATFFVETKLTLPA